MGVESRDWYLEEPKPRRGSVAPFVIGALFLALGIAGAIVFSRIAPTGTVAAGPLAGPAITIHGPLYKPGDPWQSYLADERTCPGGEDERAPLQHQANTMVCLINYARGQAGLTTLHIAPALSTAARLKGEQITRCGVFAHAPCGGDAHDVALQAGYTGAFGENLYIAQGRHGSPRVALDGWLNSQGHRENLFRPQWRVHSLYLVKLERFNEYRGATLWVSHFGDR